MNLETGGNEKQEGQQDRVAMRKMLIDLENGVQTLDAEREALRSQVEGMSPQVRAEQEIRLEDMDTAAEAILSKISAAERANGAEVAMGRRGYGDKGPMLPMTGRDFEAIKDPKVREEVATLYREADEILQGVKPKMALMN